MVDVLLIDDNADDAQLIQRQLALAGADYKVTIVSERDAVEAALERHFDVCLLDFFLPGYNGLELLQDISVEIPKRRLTVFTGVSGSGKSSLVFSTIAAESQRMINETYSAFVQGFMPTLARPDVDVLDGLTTAIIVDQQRMGANPQ